MCKENEAAILIKERRLNHIIEQFLTKNCLEKEDSEYLIMLLIENGANMPRDEEILIGTINNEYYELAKKIIDGGAVITEGALIACLRKRYNDHIPLANYMLDKVSEEAKDWHLAFIEAISQQDVDIVNRFIDLGIDVNVIGGKPLLTAIEKNNDEIFDLLLENGANIFIDNNKAIREAVKYTSNDEIVRRLIEEGADVTALNNEALLNSEFCYYGQLINAGADISSNQYKILKDLIFSDRVDSLISLFSLVSFPSYAISNALEYACSIQTHVQIIELLLDKKPTRESIENALKTLRKKYKGTFFYNQVYPILKNAKRNVS